MMMTKREPKIIKGRDVTKALNRKGCRIRRGKGSHIVGELPGGGSVVYYDGTLSKGVRCKVIKALRRAKVLLFIGAPLLGLVYFYVSMGAM